MPKLVLKLSAQIRAIRNASPRVLSLLRLASYPHRAAAASSEGKAAVGFVLQGKGGYTNTPSEKPRPLPGLGGGARCKGTARLCRNARWSCKTVIFLPLSGKVGKFHHGLVFFFFWGGGRLNGTGKNLKS